MKRQGVAPRAFRRHQAARRKRWVRRTLTRYFSTERSVESRRVGLYADTPKPCSCWMCGNPRRCFNEPPVQERRAQQEPAPIRRRRDSTR
jgi:hypothetical protein